MIVKICGITTVEAALTAQEHGADFIGFVFAKSKRRITLAGARTIAAVVPNMGKIGVFVDAPVEEVQYISRELNLAYVQLHGHESAEYCRKVGSPVIKSFHGDHKLESTYLNSFPAEWILLDSSSGGQFGGSGTTFDWLMIQEMRKELTKPLFIAGGLNSRNITTAIRLLCPDGVDVSSGVEAGGMKSEEKIREFIMAAREGERCLLG